MAAPNPPTPPVPPNTPSAGHPAADTVTATQPASGRVLAGRYRLLGELGRGGMGVVWRAEDTVIGRHVAIKEVRLPSGEGQDTTVFAERVLREVRTSGRLNDPAIVTVYDVITDGGATYIVMELVEAPTLADLVAERGPLSPGAVAAIGEQVLSALTVAHRAGIVHRDVKPSNIMVGADGRVKLTDFGIAQAVDDPRLTASGFLVGSPAFMAPERISGQDATPASDLWSLGATLYYAAEGTVAFDRGSTAATLHAIMTEVPPLTRTHGALASAIMALLVTAPEARATAEQARALLGMARQASGGPTVPGQADQPTAQGQTARYAGGPHNPPTALAAEPAAPRRIGRGMLIAGGVLVVAALIGGFLLGQWVATPDPGAQDETWTWGKGGQIPEFTIGEGKCASGGPLAENRSVTTTVDCSEVHDLQVFAAASAFSPGFGDDPDYRYPGQALIDWARARCALSFQSELIDAERLEQLRFRALVPSAEQWEATDDNGNHDRTVHCVAYDAEGKQLRETVLAEQ